MITSQEYEARRKRLAEQLGENSIAIIASAKEQLRNGDAHYPFRQNSDFYYLTGFNEPDAILVIDCTATPCTYLFNQKNDPVQAQWIGKRLGQEEACQQLVIQEAFPIELFSQKLPELLASKAQIYYCIGQCATLDEYIINALRVLKAQSRKAVQAPIHLRDLDPIISEMRLFKSPDEIKLLRRAAEISVGAHLRAMLTCKNKLYEYELEAELEYECKRQGCRSMAYSSIVGGGGNACILHYTENNQPLHAGELVLIDAGGEYHNYAADITRTFPVNGQFSDAQKKIYNVVLQAHNAGLACVKPGAPWSSIQAEIVRCLTKGLCELGLLEGEIEELIQQGAYKRFYMHSSGHWLGLDVHDKGQYALQGKSRLLEAGMVLTVEPGLYILPDPGIPEQWWNIGVRIENDILVTQTGHENLTAALPIEITAIEALMRA